MGVGDWRTDFNDEGQDGFQWNNSGVVLRGTALDSGYLQFSQSRFSIAHSSKEELITDNQRPSLLPAPRLRVSKAC